MLKINPHPDYPPENGRYLRGNDFSPVSGKITWRVTQPWAEVMDENERDAKKKALELMERLRARAKDK